MGREGEMMSEEWKRERVGGFGGFVWVGVVNG